MTTNPAATPAVQEPRVSEVDLATHFVITKGQWLEACATIASQAEALAAKEAENERLRGVSYGMTDEIDLVLEKWREAAMNSAAEGDEKTWVEPFGCTDCLNTGWAGGSPAGFSPELPREPGTCKCGRAPINKDGMCATCADEKPEPAPQWKAFHAMAWPKLWGIETTDPRAAQAGLEILVAPCMPEHAAKALANAYNFAVFTQNLQLSCVRGDS